MKKSKFNKNKFLVIIAVLLEGFIISLPFIIVFGIEYIILSLFFAMVIFINIPKRLWNKTTK